MRSKVGSSEKHKQADVSAQGPGGQRGGKPSFDRLLEAFDADESNSLSEDEVPGRVWSRLSQADADDDGEVGLAGVLGLIAEAVGEEPGAIACEVTFTGDRPAEEIAGSGDPIETALVQVLTDRPHPQLGNGALVVLALPLTVESGDAPRLANELNRLEATEATGTSLLGAWTPAPGAADQLAHATFLPNALGEPGLVTNLVAYQALRARWTAGMLS